ncbi:MAG: hypothetical protein GW850_03900 [Sphingomonadales bacterium]|nr:hypothetical protein [Sphingomonadales bacterium]NCP48324.1 hypothetical protein [Sphingomonadales bacterium]NCQ48225.1 hypothetical protein [Sphingomonadales bacterium]
MASPDATIYGQEHASSSSFGTPIFVKLALISLAKDDLDGHGPIALLPLFAGTLLDLQVNAAQRFGCEKFIFLCPVTHGALLQKIDAMKQQGLDAEYVRSPSDLVQYASDQDHIIYIADGILPNDEIIEQLSGAPQELLFTVLHAEEYQEFERIDLNQRWLGIVSLKASRLVAMIDIPDDWEIGSALLRTAVQADCPRAIISDRRMGSGAIAHLQSEISAAQFTRRKLKNMPARKDNFLNRFLLRPLIKRSLPRLWTKKAAPQYLQIFTLFSGLMAVVAAVFGYFVAALGLFFAGSIAQLTRASMVQFDTALKVRDWTGLALDLLVAAGVAILLLQASDVMTLVPNLVIFTLLLAHLLLLKTGPDNIRLALLQPDMRLVLLILLLTTIFVPISYGIYAAALYSGLSLVFDRYLAIKSSKRPDFEDL